MPDPVSKPSLKHEAVDLAKTVIVALAIALALRAAVFQPFTIPSSSMEPGLVTGDYILVSMFSYGWSRASLPFAAPRPHGRLLARSPKRGDVVVFRLPRDESVTYVKRVIGLPGDAVQVRGGQVFVNGQAVARTVIGAGLDHDDPSRPVALTRETRADGRPYLTYGGAPDGAGDETGVYRVPAGQFFMMGDNRDNSLDSRWPADAGGVGFLPAEDIIGKAQVVIASWREGASLFKPWTWATKLDPTRLLRPIA